MEEEDPWPNLSMDIHVYTNSSDEETDIQIHPHDDPVLPVTFELPSFQHRVHGVSPYYIFNYGTINIQHHEVTRGQPLLSNSDGSPYIVDLPLTPPLSTSSEFSDEGSVYARSSQGSGTGSDTDTIDGFLQYSGFTVAGEQGRFAVNSFEDLLEYHRTTWTPVNIISMIILFFAYWFLIKYFE